ncbi:MULTISPECIES: hypothetical protein [unclassified Polynucleobacter]|uniref:hypothetical protein n=1 Tax=unclassified Polynucleobacter TaxID=2640945 RepID=UPI0008CDA420|nr:MULTISPECIES: hypothetical protein [unclassified Polynucleobacter]MBU3591198.1 hypothetical protein [Polynucleobacter sp. 78F-HAINBA]OHC09970.1 MAG: hypothetical protein A2X74_09340 [Polynucleobacter sp. GWA2_45_21]HBK43054.1 hypothetical protein [Polynucleobacter sp.]
MTMILLLVAIAFALLALVRFIELVIHLIWPKPTSSTLEGDATVYMQITPKPSANSDKAELTSK